MVSLIVIIPSLLDGREYFIFVDLKGLPLFVQFANLRGGDGLERPRESRRSQGHFGCTSLPLQLSNSLLDTEKRELRYLHTLCKGMSSCSTHAGIRM